MKQHPDLFLLLKNVYVKSKQGVSTLVLIYFGRRHLWHAIKANSVTFQIVKHLVVNLTFMSILIFWKRLWEHFLRQILSRIFQEKCFSCYILLIDQIELSDCLYFLRYWAICVLHLFFSQVVTSQILKLVLSF